MKNEFKSVNLLKVRLNFGQEEPLDVGRLAFNKGKIYFEYDNSFLNSGLQISPYKLPLKSGIFQFDNLLFDGLPGVFNDSLPDGWGRLLIDRLLRSKGILAEQFSPLDRLALTGNSTIGALTYFPDYSSPSTISELDLNDLHEESRIILNGNISDAIHTLIGLNGSFAGARPKAMIGYNSETDQVIGGNAQLPTGYTHWIVKFGNSNDGLDAGAIEYSYNIMAKKASLEVPDFHLFEGKGNAGYFATKRFDRFEKNKRLHVLSACGLLHSDFRIPVLDYEDLIKATLWLTKDLREAQSIYRYAVFNVLAHNRDDHSKNFSFLMDESGTWKVAPAYDLTFSSGPRGQQSMLVAGEGQNPTQKDLLKLAKHADLSEKEANIIIDEVSSSLALWTSIAAAHGVSKDRIKAIDKAISLA